MKARMPIASSILLISMSIGLSSSMATAGDQSDGGFAVVELFTSEGCSSCPPADRLLSDLVVGSQTDGKRVYPLAFHVDYWDYIGWKDPFARPEFTQRQRRYAQVFRLSSIYTPQMIVNGSKEFVGSDKSELRKALESALGASSVPAIGLHTLPVQDNLVRVEYNLTNSPTSKTLNIALVERNLQSRVGRGENSGRTLLHNNVVRDWKEIVGSSESGSVDLKIPGDAKLENISIVAFLQDPETMRIYAAAMSALP